MPGQARHKTRPYARLPPSFLVIDAWMDDLTTERRFDSQAMWGIDVLGLFVDMLSTGVCTTTHWQTSGRLVQELIVWGQALVFAGSSVFLHYLQLASHELATIGKNVAKNFQIPKSAL